MALKDWISITSEGRITRYRITSAGRMALKRLIAEEEEARVGMSEAADPFSEQHRDWAKRNVADDTNRKRGIRYNAAESPLSALSRRKDRDGKPFLSPDLVAAGERLREKLWCIPEAHHACRKAPTPRCGLAAHTSLL